MRISLRLLLIRLIVFVALGFISALVVDHLRPTPAFCSLNAGCEQVLYSGLGEVVGVWMPIFGLVAFLALFIASLYPKLRSRYLGTMAIAGGLIGLGLILVQLFWINAVCALCMTVDVCAILIAVSYVAFKPRRKSTPEALSQIGEPPAEASPTGPVDLQPADRDQSSPWFWLVLGSLVIVITMIFGMAKPKPHVPEKIREMWVEGKINFIEITDFDCPHCKRIHPLVNRLLDEYGDRIHFVRLVMPLRRHEHARPAARCYVCAEAQGKADEMADLLFEQRQLHARVYEDLAIRLGLSTETFLDCINSSQTEKKLDEQIKWMQETEIRALPALCIQEEVLTGTQPEDRIRAAIRRAERALEKTNAR